MSSPLDPTSSALTPQQSAVDELIALLIARLKKTLEDEVKVVEEKVVEEIKKVDVVEVKRCCSPSWGQWLLAWFRRFLSYTSSAPQ
jgi:hypothetical protein